MKKLLLIALLLIPQYALARTIASDGSQANIQSIINDAGTIAGDIITIPGAAGSPQTFHWTGVLDVTKAVTIDGGSLIHNPDTKVCTADDNTIIIDDVNSSLTHLIRLHTGSRMTGLTIWHGTGTKADGQIQLTRNWTPSLRVDNCHFQLTLKRRYF